ncbi:hypothetical protein LUZ60_000284 [Juncus effusus]|nr:hypothetical protein LUZ60_000284 [Juncus effusus]
MSGRPTVRTLADLNRRPSSPDGSDDSDNPQEYYTGGEKSGMIVQDPTRGGGNSREDIFERARQMGAMPGPYVAPSSSISSFTGTGRLLSGEQTAPPPLPAVTERPPERVVHTIIFWNNGFTVDDGPLRRFDDPQNAPFLESIRKQECPLELVPSDRRTEVHVNLTRSEEDYVAPVGPKNPFQGVGRTLGGTSGGSTAEIPPQDASSSAGSTPLGLTVDDSLPSTTIQLRLADGTRMVARFNTSHTVGHIRAFIDASRPGAVRTYQLQTGFPPTILTDPSLTIDQAGLANSVIMQKM